MDTSPPYRTPDLPSARLKMHRRYLAYRVYTVVVVVGWNALVLSMMRAGFTPPPLFMLAAFPVLLPALVLVFGWAAFPWPYSAFGTLERTPFPSEPVLLTVGPKSARVGLLSLSGPFVTFTVLRSGLGISLCGARAFVHASTITDVRGGGLLGSSLSHTCPEIRSPIRFRGRSLHDALVALNAWRPERGAAPSRDSVV